MSIANRLFRGDMARMLTQRPHESILIGRGSSDPTFLAEANYLFEHGETRADAERRKLQLLRDDIQARKLADVEGEPPAYATRGLSPKRALYARYFYWVLDERKKLEALEASKVEFEALIAAPTATESEIRKLVTREADRLLGKADLQAPRATRVQLNERLINEQHGAEAAREAMPYLEEKIQEMRLRLKRLNEREDEFLKPAMIEAAENMGLGQLYAKRLQKFREVLELVCGLRTVAHYYGANLEQLEAVTTDSNGFGLAKRVRFPRLPFKSSGQSNDDYTVSDAGNSETWNQLREALIRDPHHRADHVVIPKS